MTHQTDSRRPTAAGRARRIDGYTLAAFIGVHPTTLRQWSRRGHITTYGYNQQGHALYDPTEVLQHAGWQDRLAS